MFTMVNRIKTIIDYYELSASRFADSLNVPRSTISHLLSGRNKPSFEFIQKIMQAYPEINTEWLINGKGTFLKEKEQDLFTSIDSEPAKPEKQTQAQKEDIPQVGEKPINKGTDQKHDNNGPYEEEKPPQVKGNMVESEQVATYLKGKKNSRKIERIIVIYNDDTFEAYTPRN